MKKSVVLLVIVNTSSGFIQIALAFLVQPFGYWLVPLLVCLGLLAGYKEQQRGILKQDGNQVRYLGILFLINCVFFLLIGTLFLYAPTDSFTMSLMILNSTIITFGNFEELGKFIAYRKGE